MKRRSPVWTLAAAAVSAVVLAAALSWQTLGDRAAPAVSEPRAPLASPDHEPGGPSLSPAAPGSGTPAEGDGAAAEALAAGLALPRVADAFSLLGSPAAFSKRDAIDLALDGDAPLPRRVEAVRWLGRVGDDESFAVLERVLHADPPLSLEAETAAAIGVSGHPRSREVLESLLEHGDDPVQLGAVRGMAAGDPIHAAGVLRELLLDDARSPSLRAEAATSLARVDAPEAAAALRDALALARDSDPELAESVLEGLAQQPFAESEGVFRSILEGEEVPSELEIAALGALGDASPEAAGLLLERAAHASDPAARAAAVESAALLEEDAGVPGALLGLLPGESSPEVRAELYRALSLHPGQIQAASGGDALLAQVLAETSAKARLHGYRLVASVVRRRTDPILARPFDTTMVPWLAEQAANSEAALYVRKASVDALKLASTQESREALLDLAYSGDPEIAPAAEQALRFPPARRAD